MLSRAAETWNANYYHYISFWLQCSYSWRWAGHYSSNALVSQEQSYASRRGTISKMEKLCVCVTEQFSRGGDVIVESRVVVCEVWPGLPAIVPCPNLFFPISNRPRNSDTVCTNIAEMRISYRCAV